MDETARRLVRYVNLRLKIGEYNSISTTYNKVIYEVESQEKNNINLLKIKTDRDKFLYVAGVVKEKLGDDKFKCEESLLLFEEPWVKVYKPKEENK